LKKKRQRKWFFHIVFFIVFFQVMFWWTARDLLETGQKISLSSFRLSSLKGEKITMNQGEKTTIVYFFAPWCRLCHISIDSIDKVYRSRLNTNNEINVYYIALDYESIDEIKKFSKKHQLLAQVLLGTRKIKDSFHINAFPTYYLLDLQGEIKHRAVGLTTSWGIRWQLFKTELFRG